jgi:hypothetical protein
MITYNDKTRTLTFTGEEEKRVRKFAKAHKLTFKEVVYLALMNGIEASEKHEKTKKS